MVVRSKRRRVCRLMSMMIFLGTLVTYLLSSTENHSSFLNLSRHLQREKNKENLYGHTLDLQTAKSKEPRKNIVIVAHGRSGSTITGDMFNHHASVFYLHEPLQTVQRISKHQNLSYGTLMADVLTNIFRCNFSKAVVEDIKSFYRESNHPRASYALGSPPLCPYDITDPRWDPKLCYPMTSEFLGSVCSKKYNLTVAKVLMDRITESSIKNILAACSPADVDCQIIFLIRDPRAVIMSAKSVNFFPDPASDKDRNNLRRFSYAQCSKTEENLMFVKNLPLYWRKRIMIHRYEDFASDPPKAMSRLFEFAGLSVPEHLKMWLIERTKPQDDGKAMKACEGYHPAFCTVDNSKEAINRWRWKVAFDDIDIVEHYCKHVMMLMGYTLVDGSFELMANISIPLFSEHFEVKEWLLR
ncbi:carbohydrate sulfotransferase 4-like [Montipora foliosa]|uniref:carbohydrate sulfotransferase 4-like n=1 Tax=Montipora foliosa TaxID=591990 RepID=UPI0035F1D714